MRKKNKKRKSRKPAGIRLTKKVYAVIIALSFAGIYQVADVLELRVDEMAGHILFGRSRETGFKVVRIVDGDTILVRKGREKIKVRLLGVDTPESVHFDKRRNKPEGIVAGDYSKKRLMNRTVELRFDKEKRDRYGRYLAYVYLDNEMYNEELLKKGYARSMLIAPNLRFKRQFKYLEKKARDGKLGFWADGKCYSDMYEKKHLRNGGGI